MKYNVFTNSIENLKLKSNKITLLSTLCFLLLTLVVNAQTPPNAFNYSAVARNAAGQPIATTTIGIQISILKTSPTGASQYSENHFVNTDAFGLFNLVIGAGAVQSGSMTTIDWSNDNYYLKVGMDAAGGTNFLTMGTTQLLSVPYAMYAKSAGSVSGGSGITITSVSAAGDTLYLSNGQSFVAGGNGGGTGALVLPSITTNAVTGITSNSATFGGAISNANGNQIMERGIVYSTSPNPTLGSNKIVIGNGIGTFDTISGLGYEYTHLLNPNTTYYARAYAVTENNISAYGNEVSFTTLAVGQTGPGGGIVFFSKGNATGGWQYLETATSDQSTGIIWGCGGISIPGTQPTVGSGETNTSLIVAGCNEASFAAKICNDLVSGGQTDWFLPSRDELNLVYRNLILNGQGNFNNSNLYWSSSELQGSGSPGAWASALYITYGALTSGGDSSSGKFNNFSVRAIRAF
jgi:hypothetical protein